MSICIKSAELEYCESLVSCCDWILPSIFNWWHHRWRQQLKNIREVSGRLCETSKLYKNKSKSHPECCAITWPYCIILLGLRRVSHMIIMVIWYALIKRFHTFQMFQWLYILLHHIGWSTSQSPIPKCCAITWPYCIILFGLHTRRSQGTLSPAR